MRPASSRPSVAGRALLAVTLSLVAFGLLSVYSASSYVAQVQGLEDSHYLFQQVSRAGVGLVVLAVASVVNYRLYQGLAWPLLGLTIRPADSNAPAGHRGDRTAHQRRATLARHRSHLAAVGTGQDLRRPVDGRSRG